MKVLARISLAIVLVAAIALLVFLLCGTKEKETWATLTGLLAVIAAAIGALPALRLLEIQEDALRPHPIPYFDLNSRYMLLQLRVKNFGAGVAYDVHLQWRKCPTNQTGDKIHSLDHISVLLPGESASVLVGASSFCVKEFTDTKFEGVCCFKDVSGKKLSHEFICSVDGNQKQLTYDDEWPKTLHELQELPKMVERIANALEK